MLNSNTMKTKIVEVSNLIMGTFKVSREDAGWSARKLTAFMIVIIASVMQINYIRHSFVSGDFSLLVELIVADFSFVATLFGLTTFDPSRKKPVVPTTKKKR